MTFSNRPVGADELPDFSRVAYTELEAGYAWLVLAATLAVEGVIGMSMLLFWFIKIRPQTDTVDTTVLVAGASALLVAMGLIAFYRFKAARAITYAVREHDVLRRSGLFFQQEVIQPLRRVQHVELNRGPLEKRMGLASISLFSAGSGKATFTIPGLKLITAERLRRYVLRSEQGQD